MFEPPGRSKTAFAEQKKLPLSKKCGSLYNSKAGAKMTPGRAEKEDEGAKNSEAEQKPWCSEQKTWFMEQIQEVEQK